MAVVKLMPKFAPVRGLVKHDLFCARSLHCNLSPPLKKDDKERELEKPREIIRSVVFCLAFCFLAFFFCVSSFGALCCE